MRSPAWHVRTHQCPEDTSMIANPEVEQLVHDDEVLKAVLLPRKISS